MNSREKSTDLRLLFEIPGESIILTVIKLIEHNNNIY